VIIKLKYKAMKKNIFIIGIFLLFIFSCAKEESKNVNQDSIYTIYELSYNASTDKTIAKATFRFGGMTGTLLDLNEPAIVTFNNEELLYNSITGVHKKEFARLIPTGSFIYKDLDNNTFTNAAVINNIDYPSINTISSGAAFTFTWIGNPIQTNETITLTINGVLATEVFSSSIAGTTELVLSASKLQNLGVGSATCTLQRSFNKLSVNQGTSEGGRMAISYIIQKTINISN